MMYLSRMKFRSKWAEAGFQKYLRNTSWMLGTRILSMGISFLAIIYIARSLGPTNFGQLSYAISLVALFGFIASLGIDGILYRDLIKHPEKRLQFLGTAFLIKLCAGAFATIASVAFAVFFAKDDVSKILIFILSGAFVLNAFQIIIFDFHSRADSKYPSIIALLVTLILNILKVTVIIAGNGVIYLALILLLESLLYAVLYVFIYEKKTSDTITSWWFDKNYAYSLIKDSSPLMIFGAFSMIYARIDQVFIKHMIDATAVGLYDSAVRVSDVWFFIPVIIVAALYPAIINAKKTSEELYNRRLGKLTMLLLFLAFAIAIPVSLFAPFIINVLYGNAFAYGADVLRVYIWSNIGAFLGALVYQYLIAENYRKILLFIAFVPMICNLVLNILWIPIYGIQGAAYATIISYSLMPLSLFLFKQTRQSIGSIYMSLVKH